MPNPRPLPNEEPKPPRLPNDEPRFPNDDPTWALSPLNLVPDTTDEFIPNRVDENADPDLLPIVPDDREADAIDEFETAGEKPPRPAPLLEADEPEFRENVDEDVDPRLPAPLFTAPRLPMLPEFPKLRADVEGPDRPGAAPKRAPDCPRAPGAPNPRFIALPPGLENDRGAIPPGRPEGRAPPPKLG